MKKMLFAVGTAGLIFASCVKEEVKPTSNEEEIKEASEIQKRLPSGDNRYYYSNGPKGYEEGCEVGGSDCYYTSLIVVDDCVMGPVILDDDKWLEDHANEVMSDYIAGNFDGLAAFMDASLLDGVLTGELSLQRSGSHAHGETTYLKFVNAEGVNEFVYPVIVE